MKKPARSGRKSTRRLTEFYVLRYWSVQHKARTSIVFQAYIRNKTDADKALWPCSSHERNTRQTPVCSQQRCSNTLFNTTCSLLHNHILYQNTRGGHEMLHLRVQTLSLVTLCVRASILRLKKAVQWRAFLTVKYFRRRLGLLKALRTLCYTVFHT